MNAKIFLKLQSIYYNTILPMEKLERITRCQRFSSMSLDQIPPICILEHSDLLWLYNVLLCHSVVIPQSSLYPITTPLHLLSRIVSISPASFSRTFCTEFHLQFCLFFPLTRRSFRAPIISLFDQFTVTLITVITHHQHASSISGRSLHPGCYRHCRLFPHRQPLQTTATRTQVSFTLHYSYHSQVDR